MKNSIWVERNTILYLTGTFTYKLGDKIFVLAIPWLIYEITQSSVSMGTMFLLQTLPYIFISPLAGLLADHFSQKTLLILCAIIQGGLVSLIPVLSITNALQIWNIYLIGFLIACFNASFSVVNSTMIPLLFRKDKLLKINSFYQFIDTSSVLFGSILGGFLISKIGVYYVLLLAGSAFIPIIFSTIFLRIYDEIVLNRKKKALSLNHFFEGVSFLFQHPLLRALTLLILMVNIANGALISMLVYFSRDKLLLNSEQLGLVYGVAAAAQIAAIFLVNFLSNWKNTLQLMMINLVISSLGFIWISISWNVFTLLIGVAIQSAPVIMFNVLNRTLRQKIIPLYMFGRVNGIMIMLMQCALPLSGFMTGMLSAIIDIRYIFALLGALSFIVIYLFRSLPAKQQESYKILSS